MGTYVSPFAAAVLAFAAIWGCRETPTDLKGDNPAGQSAFSPRAVIPASSATARRAFTTHFVSNGDFGEAYWAAEHASGDSIFGTLLVNRGGSPTNAQTLLFYAVIQCGPSSCSDLERGNGSIPNEDLTGEGKGRKLRLATNTASNPDFVVYAGTGGLVSVEWVGDPQFQSLSTGTSEVRFGSLTEHFAGTSKSASATATGSVAGFSIGSSQGSRLGSDQGVTVSISR